MLDKEAALLLRHLSTISVPSKGQRVTTCPGMDVPGVQRQPRNPCKMKGTDIEGVEAGVLWDGDVLGARVLNPGADLPLPTL